MFESLVLTALHDNLRAVFTLCRAEQVQELLCQMHDGDISVEMVSPPIYSLTMHVLQFLFTHLHGSHIPQLVLLCITVSLLLFTHTSSELASLSSTGGP